MPSAGQASPPRFALDPVGVGAKLRFSNLPAVVRPVLNARSRSEVILSRTSAAMSASSYGVTNIGCPAVAVLNFVSHVLAAWLAGSAGPRQPATPPA